MFHDVIRLRRVEVSEAWFEVTAGGPHERIWIVHHDSVHVGQKEPVEAG